MTFKTVKEMEAELKKVNNVNDLLQNITFMSQGVKIELMYIGFGKSALSKEVAYIGTDTATTLRVSYEGETTITVTEVKLTRK